MDLKHLSRGGINITGFQLLNYTKKDDAQWRNLEWPDPKSERQVTITGKIFKLYTTVNFIAVEGIRF